MCGPSQISTTHTHSQLVRLTSIYISNIPQAVPTLSRTPSLHSRLTNNMFQAEEQDSLAQMAQSERLAALVHQLDMNPSQGSSKSPSGVAKSSPRPSCLQPPRSSRGRPSPKTMSPGTTPEPLSGLAKAAAEPEVLQSKVQNTVAVSKSVGGAKPAPKALESPSRPMMRLAGFPAHRSQNPQHTPPRFERMLNQPSIPKVPTAWSCELNVFPIPESTASSSSSSLLGPSAETGRGSVALPIDDDCVMLEVLDEETSSACSSSDSMFARRPKACTTKKLEANCNSGLYYDILILSIFKHIYIYIYIQIPLRLRLEGELSI